MSELIPCPTCRRHARATEMTCPFCANPMVARTAVAPRIVVKLTRAALFAGATLLVPACGGSQQKTEKADVVSQIDAGTGGTVNGDSDSDSDGDKSDDVDQRLQENWRRPNGDCGPDGNNCPPYGAPPSADDRIV